MNIYNIQHRHTVAPSSLASLRDYQEKAVTLTRQSIATGHKRPLLVLPTGAGKSVIYAAIIALAVQKGSKCLFLVHRRNLVKQFAETLYKFHGIVAGTVMAGVEFEPGLSVYVSTVQTYHRRMNLDDLEFNRFFINADVLMIDECFSGNTMISTPYGEKRIDNMRRGDVVYCQTGLGVVEGVTSRPTDEDIFVLELDNGRKIECTGNHPIFTFEGWKKARELVVGARLFSIEGMRSLWKYVSPKAAGRVEEVCNSGACMERARMLLEIVCKEVKEPNEQSGSEEENEGYATEDKTPSFEARRERAITALATTGATARTREWMGIGVSDNGGEGEVQRISGLLQGGHCQPGEENRDRDRWGEPPVNTEARTGCEKNGDAYFPRVVNISRVKREGAITVFNLHVGGHPSYFANGVAVHNCHTSISKRYQDIFKAYSSKVIIGTTATPARSDGRGLGDVYDDLLDVIDVAALTEMNFLSPVRYFAPSDVDLSGIRVVLGDYENRELAERMSKPKVIGDVVENWLRLGEGRKTIVFAVNVKHSIYLRDAFIAAGVPAIHLDAKSTDDEREAAFAAMENGAIKVICNVALYVEGMDVPDISCVVMACPTKSLGKYRQCVGRGLRVSPGKTDLLMLDHAGVVKEHGYVTDEIEWSLDGKEVAWKKHKKKEKQKQPMQCPVCSAVISEKTCPECGSEMRRYGRDVKAIEADLVEVKGKKLTATDKRRWFGMFAHFCLERGYQKGWIAHKYKEKTGVWPRGMDDVSPIQPNDEFRNWMKHLAIKRAKSEQRSSQN